MERRPRTLNRSIDRMLGGVAAGLAEYLGLDPTVVRALWVVAAVFAPPLALVAYLALWVIMPAPTVAPLAPARTGPGPDGALLIGLVLVAVGALLLMSEFAWVRWLGWGLAHVLWPTLLILAGAFLLMRRRAGS